MKINLKKKSHVKGYALRGAGLRKQVTLQCMLQVFFFYSSNGCYTSSLKRKKIIQFKHGLCAVVIMARADVHAEVPA